VSNLLAKNKKAKQQKKSWSTNYNTNTKNKPIRNMSSVMLCVCVCVCVCLCVFLRAGLQVLNILEIKLKLADVKFCQVCVTRVWFSQEISDVWM